MVLLGACGRWGGGKMGCRGLSWWLADLQFILRRAAANDKQLAAPTANAYGAAGPSALGSAQSTRTAGPCALEQVALGFVLSCTACEDTMVEPYGSQVCLFVGHCYSAKNNTCMTKNPVVNSFPFIVAKLWLL